MLAWPLLTSNEVQAVTFYMRSLYEEARIFGLHITCEFLASIGIDSETIQQQKDEDVFRGP